VLATGRRHTRLLGSVGGRVTDHPRAARLVPQVRECPCRAAEVGSPRAIKAMQEIYHAEDIDHARAAVKGHQDRVRQEFAQAVEKILSEVDVLFEFNNYPADHWVLENHESHC